MATVSDVVTVGFSRAQCLYVVNLDTLRRASVITPAVGLTDSPSLGRSSRQTLDVVWVPSLRDKPG